MKSPLIKMLLLTAGAVLFNTLFWEEKIAVNAMLFAVFIVSSVFYLYPAAFNGPIVKWLLVAHCLTIATVIFHNTNLSKLAFMVTLLLVITFSQYRHRSVGYAAASGVMNYLLAIPAFFSTLAGLKLNHPGGAGIGKSIRLLLIPLLLLCLFFLLYQYANAMFKTLLNDMGIALQHFFNTIFSWFSLSRFVFFITGLLLTTGLLLKSRITYFSEKDVSRKDDLTRTKHSLLKWQRSSWFDLLSLFLGRFASGVLALRNENRTAVTSLFLLNILLLCINVVDVVYVWFGFKYNNDINLSDYVHEGTGLLIFSILLAMVLLLFFFRGNLNFYKRNKWLRYGAYAWLLQNGVLVISVLFRDYYYIVHYGLAYKRIGVLVFLLMVLVGLITVFYKIHQRKTAYYLLRVNGWCVMIVLVISSGVHWDETIARYNLARKDTIALDVKFLLTLSDKTLPLLGNNATVLEGNLINQTGTEGEPFYRSALAPKQVFENRKKAFFEARQRHSWLSWNRADEQVYWLLTQTHRPPVARQ